MHNGSYALFVSRLSFSEFDLQSYKYTMSCYYISTKNAQLYIDTASFVFLQSKHSRFFLSRRTLFAYFLAKTIMNIINIFQSSVCFNSFAFPIFVQSLFLLTAFIHVGSYFNPIIQSYFWPKPLTIVQIYQKLFQDNLYIVYGMYPILNPSR